MRTLRRLSLAAAAAALAACAGADTEPISHGQRRSMEVLRVLLTGAAWDSIGHEPAIAEAGVDFAAEFSVVLARAEGTTGGVFWDSPENVHREGILRRSTVPASETVLAQVEQAQAMALRIAEALDHIGVLTVEFFLTKSGELMINELAPRPHNTFHHTQAACVTSQFEQQVRAICGLPLGSTELLRPAAMANLLGDLWVEGDPNWAAACAFSDVKLHLYGKLQPLRGRKMGHMTVLAEAAADARSVVLAARDALLRR